MLKLKRVCTDIGVFIAEDGSHFEPLHGIITESTHWSEKQVLGSHDAFIRTFINGICIYTCPHIFPCVGRKYLDAYVERCFASVSGIDMRDTFGYSSQP